MAFPLHIYKAYDIRGIYPEECNEERAYATARWFADMRAKEIGKTRGLTLVVGRDMRLSSPMMADAVKRGFLDAGADVVDIGMVSTPTFYYAVAAGGHDGGATITASHNPKEYSGMKLVRDRAQALSKDTGITNIRDLVASGRLPEPFAPRGTERAEENIEIAAAKAAMDFVGIVQYPAIKVIIDPANCMGALDMEALSSFLPWEVVQMNWELDGSFPSHEPDPYKEENLRALQEKVKACGAQLGIALDGDADRIFFITEKGETASPVAIRSLLSSIILQRHPGAAVVYDVRPGRITEDVIRAQGGTPIVVRVGHSFIKEKMAQTGAVFAGESSGHFILRFSYGIFESSVTVVLLVLAQMAATGKTLSELVAPYGKYVHSGEINFTVPDAAQAIQTIKEHFSSRATADELDGISFDLGDVWFNVRGSNTEPLLRLNAEGESAEAVEALTKEIRRLVA